MKILAIVILLVGTATFASATFAVPEIDSNSATAGAAVVIGGLLVLRARREK